MNKVLHVCLSLAFAAAAACLAPASVHAQSVGLDAAVPEGVYIFVHGKQNSERAFLDKHWARVWEELKKTNIHEEIKTLVLSKAPAEEQEIARQHMDQICGLLSAVNWGDLFEQEMVFAGRMMFPVPEYIVLTRPNKDTLEKNVAALQSIMSSAQNAQPGISIEKIELEGGSMWSMMWTGVPVKLSMFHVRDVVGLAVGDGLMTQALDTLAGRGDLKPLIASERFKAAFDGLPAAEDERVFFDMALLVDGLDQIFGSIPQPQTAEGEPAPEAAAWMGLTKAFLGELRMMEHVAAVGYTEELRTINVAKTTLAANAKEKTFYKALGKPSSITKFHEYVPNAATSFSVSSGFDLGGFYNGLIEFAKAHVPGGEGYLAQWDGIQEQIGFNLQKDLLAWMGTRCVSVSLPGSGMMAMGGSDFVWMVEVTDSTAADEKITTWLNKLSTMMQEHGQMLSIAPATIGGNEKFMTLTHPAAAMFIRPVVGVHGGYLVLGSSGGAIEKVLQTAGGQAPSILENARFKAEGLSPDGPVQSVSFQDLRGAYTGMAQMMGMAGGMGQMFTAGMPPEQGQVATAILGMLAKMAPVVAAMDFYESTACVTTFDGQKYMTKTVVTYEPYKEEPAPVESAAGVQP